MRKLLLLIVMVGACLSIPYSKFLQLKDGCNDNKKIYGAPSSACEYDILTNKVVSPDCAIDYYRSQICVSTFSDCKEPKLDQQYPLVCFLCWTQSEAKTQFYRIFQNCIASGAWEFGLRSIVGLVTAVLLLATL